MSHSAESGAVDWRALAARLAECLGGFMEYGNEDWHRAADAALAAFDHAEASEFDGGEA